MGSRPRVIGHAVGGGGGHALQPRLRAVPELADGAVVMRDTLDVKIVTRRVAYDCPVGHVVAVPLFVGADVPEVWECPIHRLAADIVDRVGLEAAGVVITAQDGGSVKAASKTHWEHVLERRTIQELEAILEERLEVLRARRGEGTATGSEVA
jgi:PHD/YefM family antitoxin component YafN of YafNO toxin-antitoxin module